jgi:hypothetical protein
MACQCLLPFSSSLSKTPKPPRPFHVYSSISSQIHTPSPDDDDNYDKTKKQPQLNLLNLSATLTIISASLPQPAIAAVQKRSSKKTKPKKPEALTPEELKSWAQGLPIISNRIPYTQLLEFTREGKLKHVIKLSSNSLRHRTEPVLVVLEDSRVLRTVLPSLDGNQRFWESWDELNIESQCVNAYTPPVKKPELPSPYLGFLVGVASMPEFMLGLMRPKKESKRAMEMRRIREELKREKKEDLERMRTEREMMDTAMRVKKKEEEKRRRRELMKKKHEKSLLESRENYENMADMWGRLAQDPNVSTALGLVFFVIFYWTVVLSYRKQKKDYDDRLKIQKAEAEERKKMRELEREMQGLEGEGEDEEEGEQGKGENNPYLKMAMQFMKSGARVRRAQNKRLPQYLERGVDVKFTDVAGLGKIRLELEEIVKFFTHGEMYRRRGVKIPG